MNRGHNLQVGEADGDNGRRLGGSAKMSMPAPEDCEHCRERGYRTMAQHLGHRGLAKAAKRKGLTVEKWCKHLVAKNDPWPENGAHSQWLIEGLP